MRQFSELGIKSKDKAWAGEKIKFKKLLNKKIAILDYKIRDSRYPEKGNGKCLHMQINMDNKKYVTWTGSVNLQDTMLQVGKEQLPIEATPIEDNDRFEFT